MPESLAYRAGVFLRHLVQGIGAFIRRRRYPVFIGPWQRGYACNTCNIELSWGLLFGDICPHCAARGQLLDCHEFSFRWRRDVAGEPKVVEIRPWQNPYSRSSP